MTEYLAVLLMTWIAFLFAVLSPGPNILGILSVSLDRGRSAGMLMGLGIAFGSLTWATLTVIGLTQFVARYSFLLQLIKLLGGLYLIYLAYMAFRSSRHLPEQVERYGGKVKGNFMLRGYLLMMTNPKAALAWVAILSLTTFSSGPGWLSVAAVSGTFTISIVVHLLFAVAFSNKVLVERYSMYRSNLLKGFSAIYGALGLKLLSSVN